MSQLGTTLPWWMDLGEYWVPLDQLDGDQAQGSQEATENLPLVSPTDGLVESHSTDDFVTSTMEVNTPIDSGGLRGTYCITSSGESCSSTCLIALICVFLGLALVSSAVFIVLLKRFIQRRRKAREERRNCVTVTNQTPKEIEANTGSATLQQPMTKLSISMRQPPPYASNPDLSPKEDAPPPEYTNAVAMGTTNGVEMGGKTGDGEQPPVYDTIAF